LCVLWCEAVGGQRADAIPTAAALELFHNWILIHDDIEDGSDMRRGQPVLHRRYGIPLALNAGDALHVQMWHLLLKNRARLGDTKSLRVLSEVLRMVNETTQGQHMELAWVREDRWDLQEADYLLMCEKKTSWYTCISPSRLGGLIGGATPADLQRCIPFGRQLGIAFQIRDDILNLEGEERKYGKERGGDLLEGKRTLMLIRLLNLCRPAERERILGLLSKPRTEKTPDLVEELLGLMQRYDVIEYARRYAGRLTKAARRSFESIFEAKRGATVAKLRDLIDFMTARDW
jgi:geranylgeranyl diphosphate synthase type II